jgi:glutamate-1-semialdehyde 2,1-aminomutase
VTRNVESALSRIDTSASERLDSEAKSIFPGGVSHNLRYFEPHPLYVQRQEGAKVWDADGNEYVDFWMDHLTSILGHTYPRVSEAVAEQASQGLHYGAPNEPTLRLAQRIPEFVPSAERVRFCASGTEATMYAVRLARAFSGRDYVLKAEGGWHGGNTDLSAVVSPPFDEKETAGLPPGAAEHVGSFSVNDREGTKALLDELEGDVAGVIIEPFSGGGTGATEEFLRFLKDESERRDFVLIFDEVVTGFRFKPGSYQARVGVEPDLTTLGKVLGGGLPVGAIAGRANLFENARPDAASSAGERVLAGGGTFSMNPMTATAGLETLSVLQEEPVYDHIETQGKRVRTELQNIFDGAGVDGVVTGEGSLFLPHFHPEVPLTSTGAAKGRTDREALNTFHKRLLEEGYYFLPGHMGATSYQTSETQLDRFLEACRGVVDDLTEGGVV